MKKLIALSSIAFLSTALFANADLEKRLETLEKKNDYLMKKVSEVNEQSANDNIKFDVDLRTSYDNLQYKTVGGEKFSNDALYSSRLWLNMGFAPTDTMVFKGQLAYHKAFGASPAADSNGLFPQRGSGFDTFDWVSNQTLNDDKVRVREAYWLWTPKVGDVGFTVSVGRRPSTNGYLANLREDDPKPKSPSGHVINMEFDGASAGIQLDKVLPGMLFKICLGRGLTNAKAWANEADSYVNWDSSTGAMPGTSPNYIESDSGLDTVDMAGFIFVPYDDGQYAVQTTWYRGFDVPGLDAFAPMSLGNAAVMKNMGDMDGMAISAKVSGIGDGISDFLDDTTVFASYAVSKSHPKDGARMFGSGDSKTGNSVWIGALMPNMTGGKFGIEYNRGSKDWKSFTFGEDTMIGSKLNARGNAYEAYWTQPLIKNVFSMQVRYTHIDYKHTGSNGFFGDGGQSMTMAAAKANPMMDPVETAQDLRVYFRYRY